jgi:hypothetical protein
MTIASRQHLVLLLALLLVVVGCGGGAGRLVLEDDFDGSDDAWGSETADQFSRGYASGRYNFDIIAPDWLAWTTVDRKLTDSRIVINAHLSAGSEDSHFGAVCRLRDAGTFYYLAVSPDGFYGIFRRIDGGPLQAINESGAMVHSPAIRTGNESNLVEAICDGDTLTLLANGEVLETVVDDSLRRGRFGFGAASGPQAPVRIGFDDIEVYSP